MTATSVWIGVDASKTSHHAALIDAAGKKLWSVKVGNGQRQIEELVERAAVTAAKSGGQVRWAVDLVSPAAALLIAILLTSGQKVVYVPGRMVHGMAGIFRGEGKTDAKDARIIAERFRTHPQAHIIDSLPGMGPLLGAQFVVATNGDVRAAFTHAGLLASYAGLAPVPRDSGRITGNNRRPKRFNRPLRQVFYMAALYSIRADGLSRAFHRRKRDENKLHTQALLALARRLVDVLWALLRDNRVFSPVPPQQVTALAA